MPANTQRASHFDLMLQQCDQLRTWAIPQLPLSDRAVQGLQLPPHRLKYLHFEGDISGNRGSVRRIDRGEYTMIVEQTDRLEIAIDGQVLSGKLQFVALPTPQLWEISFLETFANL